MTQYRLVDTNQIFQEIGEKIAYEDLISEKLDNLIYESKIE